MKKETYSVFDVAESAKRVLSTDTKLRWVGIVLAFLFLGLLVVAKILGAKF